MTPELKALAVRVELLERLQARREEVEQLQLRICRSAELLTNEHASPSDRIRAALELLRGKP